MLQKRHRFFVICLGLSDALVLALAAIAVWFVRLHLAGEAVPGLNKWEDWFKDPLLMFVVPLGIVCVRASGLYRPRRDRSLMSELLDVGRATAFTIGLLVFTLWAVSNDAVLGDLDAAQPIEAFGMTLSASRFQLVALGPAILVLLATHRILFRVMLRVIRSRGWNMRHIYIIGTGRLGQVAAHTIARNSWTGMRVAGFITHHPKARRDTFLSAPVLGGLEDLETILEGAKIDAVYLALPGAKAGMLPTLLRRLDRFTVDVRVIPDVPTRYLPHAMTVAELDGMPVLSYRESPLVGMGGLNKRALDIAGALFGLVFLSWLFAIIAIAVRLSGPGPVIFRQRRVSIGGDQFKIYKFRTMYHESQEHRPGWTTRDDPRVTPVGRFLRKTSLDELPQLYNVLRGQMSLVGPRPERPELIELFREDWRGYMLRHHVKAGMTGWAQVNGLRGDTSLRKRLQYDLFYVRNWSLLFDVRILILTITRGVVHRNAH